jgi:predicted N-acetyltransferase YhbS
MFTIDLLKNHPKCIPALATIWKNVLGQIWLPNVCIERVEGNLHNHLNSDQLPLTFVAFDDNMPVGMCSLRVTDGIRPDLTPWLGSLVVAQNRQNQGIGMKLINRAKEKALEMGFETLYLLTFDTRLHGYYERLGWSTVSQDELQGNRVTIMNIDLKNTI